MNTQIASLAEACKQLGIPHSSVASDENFLRVEVAGRRYYFPGTSNPFNDSAVVKICSDKEFTYKLLGDAVRMPRTMGWVDPESEEEFYRAYASEKSHAAVAARVIAEFGLPVIVKRNSGSTGKNVFLCKKEEDVATAVTKVFNREIPGYDHVLLAQEYVESAHEYRAIVFRKEVLLVYEKDVSGATFTGNLSPLHWENSRAVHMTDPALIERIAEFAAPIYDLLELHYGGLDIIEDQEGQLNLLEINSKPTFGVFARDNGKEALTAIFVEILNNLA